LRKVFQPQGLGLDLGCKAFIIKECCCKVLISDEKERSGWFWLEFEPLFNCTGLARETCHGYVVGEQWFRLFWGLTCDFWAENAEK
jgi:hypothetical protein